MNGSITEGPTQTRGGQIVTATGLHRRYGEGEAAVEALAGVSVDFDRGRFAAIMGPSGSGKSTLMHVLAGLDEPTSGSVTLDGVRLEDLACAGVVHVRTGSIRYV